MNVSFEAYKKVVMDLYLTGQDNAYEAFLPVYEKLEGECDIEYIERCLELDWHDIPYQGAIYQEIYDDLKSKIS